MSIARHHAEWLSLLEISGPFLPMPVLMRAFPQGLDALDSEVLRELRPVYEEWLDNQGGLRPDPAIHRVWVEWVLRSLLEFPETVIIDLAKARQAPQAWTVPIAEHGEALRPDFAIVDPAAPVSSGQSAEMQARLLVQVLPPGQDLEKPLAGAPWKASPATRMMTLLHGARVRLGLLTNGEQWALVDAPTDGTTALISWYAELWLEEPLTLRAFRSLLGAYRFFAVPEGETLDALLAASADEQHEVTNQLGYQVRRAVEMLVQALDLADQDMGGMLLEGLSEAALYEAAVRVMMRLVFLLCAEERGLLPLDDPFYNQHYAVSTLRAQLREAADQAGEEILERRSDSWCRLLAAFRAVHGGIQHDRLHLPAYGGGLFDPDELPFLEGRPAGSSWRTAAARPLPINNRTVLHLLDALQMLQVKVPGGGPAEARRLSFRALDIEQIGYVYEGLLDHTAKRAAAPVFGLQGTRDREPEVPLPDLEAWQAHGQEALLETLRQQTGRSASALARVLEAEPDLVAAQQLRAACGNDPALYARVLPFAGLVRNDSYGQPVVIRAGSAYVTAGTARRDTGTQYTPRSFTEPIVQRTLEPLVYRGPAEGWPREKWRLRSAAELLALKICDMGMGSAAFLVQVCRYLSERLVEAWEAAESLNARSRKKKWITGEGMATDNPDEAIPADTAERLALARRLIADRCLYGVDKNPLAVEMAKLSLWLITLAKGRPFTFLDHALKCGDSLVGVDLDQLVCWNLEGKGPRHFDTVGIRADIDRMVALRRQIATGRDLDTRDQAHKAHLLAQAEAIAHDLRRGADMLVGSYYNTLAPAQQRPLRDALLDAFRRGTDVPPERAAQADLGGLRPFHWTLEFPEVFLDGRGGFDAFVGNPPFLGGQRISGTLGDCYFRYLRTAYPSSHGTADLVSFFFLRAFGLLRQSGTLGLIATNTIAQGDTRETGLERIVEQGGAIYSAQPSVPWPGAAAVHVSVVHIAKDGYAGQKTLDGTPVPVITPLLDSTSLLGKPYVLAGNAGKSFQGSILLGTGFLLTPDEARALVDKDPRNADVLFPYLNGEDLNSHPEQQPSRWAINFFDWPLERAEQYPDCLAIVREKVYPERMAQNDRFGREYWWRFLRLRPEMYRAIAQLRSVLAVPLTSKHLSFAFSNTHWVHAHACGVIAAETNHLFAILQSNCHEAWARKHGSTLETRLRYTPADVFETFPFPQSSASDSQRLARIGEAYHEHRRQLMLARWEGLTATNNRFHDPEETSADIARLRELHVEMDQAVAAAYGWGDLDLDHGFHSTAQGVRYTISEPARREVLDRLLALNHERYAAEVQQGLHEKKGKRSTRQATRDKAMKENQEQYKLF